MAAKKNTSGSKKHWCGICQDWFTEAELWKKPWGGDGLSERYPKSLLCPGCDVELVSVERTASGELVIRD